jgi:hypothetical protein
VFPSTRWSDSKTFWQECTAVKVIVFQDFVIAYTQNRSQDFDERVSFSLQFKRWRGNRSITRPVTVTSSFQMTNWSNCLNLHNLTAEGIQHHNTPHRYIDGIIPAQTYKYVKGHTVIACWVFSSALFGIYSESSAARSRSSYFSYILNCLSIYHCAN